MSSYVTAELRRLVESRAQGLCEYCLIHQRDTYLGCQVDHVISEKHGGPTLPENLAYACTPCNRAKGSDVGSILPTTGEFTRLFNPRIDHWAAHFTLRGPTIQARSPIGEATVHVLRFNETERLLERQALQRMGRYPPEGARKLLIEADLDR
jgi:hypothetical protein